MTRSKNAKAPTKLDSLITDTLAPDIQRAIIEGHQAAGLNLERLVKSDLPICWNERRKAFGFEVGEIPCSGREQGNGIFTSQGAVIASIPD